MTEMTDFPDTQEFDCVSPAGERFAFTVRIGCPTPVSNQPDSDWRCPVTVSFDGRMRDIYGIDSGQARSLALGLVHSLLVGFLRRGGRLYRLGSDHELNYSDFLHAFGHQ
jgi:hypothetical protein